eukprot:TRINITY_DN3802_c0_g2_i1.p1 TRINITY_DN3802_c0_g2~~TRINITY_DN3802_c0_g2_i1.p1  ORF type:complete len:502 (-),score=124.25 TRINITY_DN3802_c0_g2_i1:176-1681(-)
MSQSLPTEDEMRPVLRDLLQDVVLADTSIGKLRASLEQKLGLNVGSLDCKRDEVNEVLRQELQLHMNQADGSKKRKNESADAEPSKKEKKDKKDKKEKKDKDEKGTDVKASEPVVSKPAPAPAPAPAVAKVPPPVAKPPPPADLEVSAPAPPAPVTPPSKNTSVGEQLAVEPQVGVTIGMSAFEDFGLADMVADKSKTQQIKQKMLAISGAEDGNLRLWDVESSTCVRVLEGHVGTVRSISVDWDLMQALSGAQDNVKLWSLKGFGCQRTFADFEGGCSAVAADWKIGFKAIGGCGDGKLFLWNMGTGDVLASVIAHPGGVWAVSADWARKKVATAGDVHLKIWDSEELGCLMKIDGFPGNSMSLAMDWDRNRALLATTANCLQVWNLDTREPQNLIGHTGPVCSISADWSTKTACSASWDGTLRVWTLGINDGGVSVCTKSHEMGVGRVRSAAIDFDENQTQAVCGDSGGALHVFDLLSGLFTKKLEGHVGAVTAVAARF